MWTGAANTHSLCLSHHSYIELTQLTESTQSTRTHSTQYLTKIAQPTGLHGYDRDGGGDDGVVPFL